MALATLADLKRYLSISGGNVDAELTALLDACSAMIEREMARQVTRGTRTERRHGNGLNMLQLRDAPIVSVASLTIDGQAIQNADSNNGVGYLFSGSQLFLTGGPMFCRGTLNVSVTYDAGYETVPADLAHAVIETAAQAFKEKDWIGYQSKSLGGETVSFLRSAMPDSARRVVATYARTYPLD